MLFFIEFVRKAYRFQTMNIDNGKTEFDIFIVEFIFIAKFIMIDG